MAIKSKQPCTEEVGAECELGSLGNMTLGWAEAAAVGGYVETLVVGNN